MLLITRQRTIKLANKMNRIASIALKGVFAVLFAAFIAAIPACGNNPASGTSSSKAEALDLPFGGGSGESEATGADFSQPEKVAEAKLASDTGGLPAICTDYVNQGYVTAQADSAARLKFQVKAGEQTYNYDLPNDGTQTIYPVNMGNGSYSFRIMQNTSGSNYVELFEASTDVKLDSEFAPFLMPNMFCNYKADSKCVSKARDLTSSVSNQGQVVKSICEFVAGNVTYDNAKAQKLAKSSGYVPSPDETLQSGTGICFDYASLSAAMLRSLGVPTRVMTGYVGKEQLYHAWIMVYIDGSWHTAVFSVDPNTWSRCDVTFASTGATQYVGDASAYTDKYMY